MLNDKGVWFLLPPEGDKIPEPEFVCSHLEVIAITKDDKGENFGRLLKIRDIDNHDHTFAMPMKMLAGDATVLREILYSKGLHISSNAKSRQRLTQYLQEIIPSKRVLCVNKTGWFQGTFILPTEVIGDTDMEYAFQTDSLLTPIYEEKGSLEEWKEAISLPCIDNSRLVFSVSCAFAAPLIELLNFEGGGVHFYGPSSRGKTTLLRVAASVYGAERFFLTWRATANALESAASQHNDCLMVLDELAQITPEHAFECSYMLANGEGKSRCTKPGDAKPSKQWRCLFLSTGEITLAQHIKEGKRQVRAGQEVRIINIPAEAQYGIFDNVSAQQSCSSGAELSDYFKEACKRHYGTAGKEFLRQLVANREQAIKDAREIIDIFIKKFSQKNHSQNNRIVKRFALVAAGGILASRYGITGWDEDEVWWALERCLKAHLETHGEYELKEEGQILSHIKIFLEKHTSSRLPADEDEYQKSYNQAGFRKDLNGQKMYCIFQEVFKEELCIGSLSFVISVLDKHKWLVRGPNNSPTNPIRIKYFNDGKPSRFYCLDASKIFGEELQK